MKCGILSAFSLYLSTRVYIRNFLILYNRNIIKNKKQIFAFLVVSLDNIKITFQIVLNFMYWFFLLTFKCDLKLETIEQIKTFHFYKIECDFI